MEMANKVANAVLRVANNNIVIDVCLGGAFAALAVRSVNQQNDIEALEAEKEALVQSNKAIKKAIWDGKQQLYAEASSDAALVPLARLRSIYGEAPTPQLGNTMKENATSSGSSKFIV